MVHYWVLELEMVREDQKDHLNRQLDLQKAYQAWIHLDAAYQAS
jgi:hypothetical protein